MVEEKYYKYLKEIYNSDLSQYNSNDVAIKCFKFGLLVANKEFWRYDENPPFDKSFLVNIDGEIFIGTRSNDKKPCIFNISGNYVKVEPIESGTKYLWADVPSVMSNKISFDYGVGIDFEMRKLSETLSNVNGVFVLDGVCSSNDNKFNLNLKITNLDSLKFVLECFSNSKSSCKAIFESNIEYLNSPKEVFLLKINSLMPYQSIDDLMCDINILVNRIQTL